MRRQGAGRRGPSHGLDGLSNLLKVVGALQGGRQPGATAKAGWRCHCNDCEFALKGRTNWADRETCWGCCRPKSKAMHPPKASRIPAAGSSVAAGGGRPPKGGGGTAEPAAKPKGTVRKGGAGSGPAGGAAAGAPAAGGGPAEEPPAPPPPGVEAGLAHAAEQAERAAQRSAESRGERLALDPELAATLGDIWPVLSGILKSLSFESMPQPAKARSAEAVVAERLGAHDPGVNSATRARLETDIGAFEYLLDCAPAGCTDLLEQTKSKLEAARKALQKETKAVPSAAAEEASLVKAKADLQRAAQERAERAQAGVAKAAERRAHRRGMAEALVAQLMAGVKAVEALEVRHAAAHRARHAAAAQLEAEATAILDRRIADVVSRRAAAGAHAQTVPPAPVLQAAAAAAATAVDAAPGQAGPEAAELAAAQRRISELEDRLKQAAAAADDALAASLREFERVLDDPMVPESLPVPAVPTQAAEVEACSHLYQLLSGWMGSGANTPFTWETLASTSTAGDEVRELVSRQLGPLMLKWYPNPDVPATGILPRQLVVQLYQVLEGLKAKYVLNQATKESAANSHAVIREAHKRLRASN